MGLQDIQIKLDNPWGTYYAGSNVSGQLVLKLDSPKMVKSISIKIKGESNVKWSEQESRTDEEGKTESVTVWYTSHELYFENNIVVFGGIAGDMVKIPSGTQVYDFSTILPPTLPSSFEGEYGHVRYTIKATLDIPWRFDQGCKIAFTVISLSDLNLNQDAKRPIRMQDEKTVGICCCASGPLSISLNVPFKGFVSGQYIPVDIEVENLTTRRVTHVYCKLKKKVVFKVTRPSYKTWTSDATILITNLGTLGPHSNNRYKENLLLPPLPPSGLSKCSIIDIQYSLEIDTDVSGCCGLGLGMTTPIILGTAPLVDSISPQPLPPTIKVGAAAGNPAVPSAPLINLGSPSQLNSPDVTAFKESPPPPYPAFPAPSFEESAHSKTDNIRDEKDSEYVHIVVEKFSPRYPTYKLDPPAYELH